MFEQETRPTIIRTVNILENNKTEENLNCFITVISSKLSGVKDEFLILFKNYIALCQDLAI